MKAADCGRKNKGFALPEVLCAIVILSLSILASFAAMSYALTLTNESRGRMKDFSEAMQYGVETSIWAEYEDGAMLPPNSHVGKILWKPALSFEFQDDGGASVTIGGSHLKLDMTEFRVNSGSARRFVKAPVFIVFSTKELN
jgi:prepilin-type N-terminal cleavage/methylation domain-containing protein